MRKLLVATLAVLCTNSATADPYKNRAREMASYAGSIIRYLDYGESIYQEARTVEVPVRGTFGRTKEKVRVAESGEEERSHREVRENEKPLSGTAYHELRSQP